LYQYTWPIHVRNLGGGAVELGFLTMCTFLVSAACVIPGGLLTDILDRRRLLIIGWSAAVPAPLLFTIARSWQALIPGQILFGLNMLPLPALQAYVMDAVHPSRRAYLYSVISAAFYLGMTISPGMGGLIAAHFSMRAVFWLACAFYAISTLVLLPVSPQQPPPRAPVGHGSRLGWDGRFAAICALFAMMVFAQNVSHQFATPYFQDVLGLGVTAVGFLGSLTSFGMFLLAILLGRYGDRAGRWRAVLLSLAVMAGAPAILLVSRSLHLTWLAALLRGYNGVPLMTAIVNEEAGHMGSGKGLGLFNLFILLSMAAASLAGGRLYEMRPAAPFGATIILLIGSGAWILAGRCRPSARGPAIGAKHTSEPGV